MRGQAIARDARVVDMAALEAALGACAPRITREMLDFYQAFAARQRA